MTAVDVLPLLAAAAAVPQLLPQLVRLVRTREVGGVSPAWAALTAAGNVGWATYFASTALWTGLVPAVSCGVLAVLVLVALALAGAPIGRGLAVGGSWLAVLAAAFAVGGPTGLGSALALAFVLQVIPSLRAAWRASSPVGVSRSTWVLIGIDVTCWGATGVLDGRPPLIALGLTGIAAVTAMLVLTRPGRRSTGAPAILEAPAVA